MSLLDDAMTELILMDKKRIPDGEGGFMEDGWMDSAPFMGAITFDSSMQARIGEKQGVKSLYTVTTKKNAVLNFHDVFRRLSDGKIFRVTSDGDDKFTPASATLDMRQVTAEEYNI